MEISAAISKLIACYRPDCNNLHGYRFWLPERDFPNVLTHDKKKIVARHLPDEILTQSFDYHMYIEWFYQRLSLI